MGPHAARDPFHENSGHMVVEDNIGGDDENTTMCGDTSNIVGFDGDTFENLFEGDFFYDGNVDGGGGGGDILDNLLSSSMEIIDAPHAARDPFHENSGHMVVEDNIGGDD